MVVLVNAIIRLQEKETFLKDQLEQIAHFNPDWDRLQVAIDCHREVLDLLKTSQDENKRL